MEVEMSVVELKSRMTTEWDNFHGNICSSDSLVYCNKKIESEQENNFLLEVSVGNYFYDSNFRKQSISDSGLVLKPKEYYLIETEEKIALPNNILGIIVGKGTMIVSGIIVFSGKIEPGFNDNLKIALVNENSKPIVIKKYSQFCSCIFFNTESSFEYPPPHFDSNSPGLPTKALFIHKKRSWIKNHIFNISMFLVAIASLLVAVLKG